MSGPDDGEGHAGVGAPEPGVPGILDAEGVVFLGPGTMEIAPYRVDPPGPGEVRIRMAASGVCHSDLHVLDGDWTRPAPTVMGHEGAGWVESVGPNPGTNGPRVGDFVVLAWTAPCGRCASCRRAEGWLCLSPAGSGHRLRPADVRIRRPDGSALGAYSGIGTLGSVQVVAADAAIRVDPRTDPAVAALIGCAITTGVGAVTRTARVRPGESVAVIGLGGVGLAAVLGARLAGARRIVAIDRLAAKLDRAIELGATDAVVAAAGPAATAAAVRSLLADGGTLGTADGVDHAFETSGTVSGVETAVAVVRPGGTTVLVGMPAQGARVGPGRVRVCRVRRPDPRQQLRVGRPGRDLPGDRSAGGQRLAPGRAPHRGTDRAGRRPGRLRRAATGRRRAEGRDLFDPVTSSPAGPVAA
jgi:S-(hydroxymethyl)glutathione dehydrogenase/alcohol dehydrogenase